VIAGRSGGLLVTARALIAAVVLCTAPSLVVAQRAATASASPINASALIERTAALYAGSRGMRAEFTQRVRNPITSSEASSAGSYLQRGPGVFSIAFTQPAGDRIVSDGRTLWVYVPSATPGQVLKMPVGAGAPGGVDLVGQFFTSPSRRYTVTDGGAVTVNGAVLRKLVLVPRTPEGISRAVILVEPATAVMKQLEVTEASGVVRTLSFGTITRGTRLPADAFTFVVPRGITVVDQAALMRGS
jgi:outer membrane lipoprotein carrier protein